MFDEQKTSIMKYTEQQKKEYQAMRRNRKQHQQELKSYLRCGRQISKEENQLLIELGYTRSGKVLKNQRTSIRQSVVNQGYKSIS